MPGEKVRCVDWSVECRTEDQVWSLDLQISTQIGPGWAPLSSLSVTRASFYLGSELETFLHFTCH